MSVDYMQEEMDALRAALQLAVKKQKCAEAEASYLKMRIGALELELRKMKGKEPKGKKR